MQVIEIKNSEFGVLYKIYNIFCLDGRRILTLSDSYVVWNE